MLLVEDDLTREIELLLKNSTQLRIAVAFIGDGASKLIGSQVTNVQIICNLTMGGSNPHEIEKLIARSVSENINIKQIDNLHAKLYIGDKCAIVGSANMSSNGLGMQPNALKEAGYKFQLNSESQQEVDWFSSLWACSKEITKDDIENAKKIWQRRDRRRNGEHGGIPSCICNYDFDHDKFPLITFCQDTAWSVSDSALKGKEKTTLESIIGDSLDIETKGDIDTLNYGQYVFMYERDEKSCFPVEDSKSSVTLCSKGIVMKNAYHHHDDPNNEIDVMLCDETEALFGLDNEIFYKKFISLIKNEKFRDLREEGPHWFNKKRIELMREFWKELQEIVCEQDN